MNQAPNTTRIHQLPWKWGLVLASGLLLLGWLFNTPPGVLGKADAVGYAVCHRIDIRSFHLHDRTLPLCARCTGMYLGAILSLGYQVTVGRRRSGLPTLWGWVVLLGLGAAFALDGVNSYLHLEMMTVLLPWVPRLYEPSNTLRLFTGTGMGIVIMAALLPVFNQTIWADLDPRPALGGWLSLGGLLASGVALDLLILTEFPAVLAPLAVLSALGVPLILGMVYTMVWVMMFRRENQFKSWKQLAWPLLAGFLIALLQIAFLDFIRYQLTGTWAGFSLG